MRQNNHQCTFPQAATWTRASRPPSGLSIFPDDLSFSMAYWKQLYGFSFIECKHYSVSSQVTCSAIPKKAKQQHQAENRQQQPCWCTRSVLLELNFFSYASNNFFWSIKFRWPRGKENALMLQRLRNDFCLLFLLWKSVTRSGWWSKYNLFAEIMFMKTAFSPQRRKTLLVLPTNMAAMTTVVNPPV